MHCTIHVNGQRCLLDDVAIFALLCGSGDYPLVASVIIGLGIPYITTDVLTEGVLFSTALSDASA